MTQQLPRRPIDRHGFKIGIICALSLEADMVERVFDRDWMSDGAKYGKAEGDTNTYTTGLIGDKNVVLAYCSTIGSNNAAQIATGLRSSFPQVKMVFLVGVCGVAPYTVDKEEIVLGDCMVSTAVVQFDLGRQGPSGFKAKAGLDALGRVNIEIGSLLTKLKTSTNRARLDKNLMVYLSEMQTSSSSKIHFPGNEEDRLFKSSYTHSHRLKHWKCRDCDSETGICGKSCTELGCKASHLVPRRRLKVDTKPTMHFGVFGSSNIVLKSAEYRDKLNKDKEIVAFEMEGSGIWEVYSTVIIKAACDYADSHKNKLWQPYAAAVAAAGLKAFLQELESFDEASSSGAKPRHYRIPFLANQRFVGRESKLQELEQQLLKQKECHTLAIYGLGGIGKTQLTLAFAHAVKQRYPEYSIFWASALSIPRFRQDCIDIATECSLHGDNDEDVIDLLKTYLSSEAAGRWLLVIDNADDRITLFDDKTSIVNCLPRSQSGITLFTTRHKEIAYDLADGYIMNLGEMTLEDAKLFLNKALRQDIPLQDGALVEELLEYLSFLPLAIAQACAYITKKSITISKYLSLLKNTEENLIKLLSHDFRDGTRDNEADNAVAKTWLVSFKQIQRDSPEAAELLYLIAFLENKNIPLSLLSTDESDPDSTDHVGTLVGYSFLSQHEKGETFDMHRLVHRAVKIWMENENINIVDLWKDKTVFRLSKVFPLWQWEYSSLWPVYIPHAIRVLRDTEQIVTVHRAELCLRLGQCLLEQGRFPEAVKWIEECVSKQGQLLPEEDPDRLSAQHTLGRAYKLNGQVEKSIEVLEKVVALRGETLGEESSERLASQHTLAIAYSTYGQHKEAMDLLEEVVAIEAKVLLESDSNLLTSQHTLAVAYESNGRVDEAVQLLEKVIALKSSIYPSDHPILLASQHALAVMYLANKRSDKAVSMLEEIVATETKFRAGDHPSVLSSQHALANAYSANDQHEEALELLEKVVAIKTKLYAETHFNRLASENNLAILYEHDGEMDKAISMMQHVVRVEEKFLQTDHPNRLISVRNLERMLRVRQGKKNSENDGEGSSKEGDPSKEDPLKEEDSSTEEHPSKEEAQD